MQIAMLGCGGGCIDCRLRDLCAEAELEFYQTLGYLSLGLEDFLLGWF